MKVPGKLVRSLSVAVAGAGVVAVLSAQAFTAPIGAREVGEAAVAPAAHGATGTSVAGAEPEQVPRSEETEEREQRGVEGYGRDRQQPQRSRSARAAAEQVAPAQLVLGQLENG